MKVSKLKGVAEVVDIILNTHTLEEVLDPTKSRRIIEAGIRESGYTDPTAEKELRRQVREEFNRLGRVNNITEFVS